MLITRRELLLSLAGSTSLSGETLPLPDDLKVPHKAGRLVIPPSRRSSDFDHKGADVPFVFRHDDRHYMTYVGFDGNGYQTGMASSEDLLHWRKEGLVLPRKPESTVLRHNAALSWILRENDVFSSGRLKQVHGRYVGVYHAYPKPGYEEGAAVIGLCWSDDLRTWEIETPCLRAEDGGHWERGGLYKACLVEHDGTYYIFYNAKDAGRRWKEQTGFATSRDLRTWSRYAGNPVVQNGPPGSPDERFASDPCVLAYRDGWAMFYFGLDDAGVARDLLALSDDLRQWRKCDGILIDTGPPGSVDSKYAHKPSLIHHDGVLYHYYCAVSPEHGRGIAVAASRPR